MPEQLLLPWLVSLMMRMEQKVVQLAGSSAGELGMMVVHVVPRSQGSAGVQVDVLSQLTQLVVGQFARFQNLSAVNKKYSS